MQVKWNGRKICPALSARRSNFRFFLTNGKLYSFWVTRVRRARAMDMSRQAVLGYGTKT